MQDTASKVMGIFINGCLRGINKALLRWPGRWAALYKNDAPVSMEGRARHDAKLKGLRLKEIITGRNQITETLARGTTRGAKPPHNKGLSGLTDLRRQKRIGRCDDL